MLIIALMEGATLRGPARRAWWAVRIRLWKCKTSLPSPFCRPG